VLGAGVIGETSSGRRQLQAVARKLSGRGWAWMRMLKQFGKGSAAYIGELENLGEASPEYVQPREASCWSVLIYIGAEPELLGAGINSLAKQGTLREKLTKRTLSHAVGWLAFEPPGWSGNQEVSRSCSVLCRDGWFVYSYKWPAHPSSSPSHSLPLAQKGLGGLRHLPKITLVRGEVLNLNPLVESLFKVRKCYFHPLIQVLLVG